jgi:hypothetical protein
MRRATWIWIIGALVAAILVVSIAEGFGSSSAPSGEALRPTLVDLVRQTAWYEGKRVRVTGDVRVFEAGTPDEYYVLEQDGQYRVAIHGLPLSTLRPLTNAQMTIEGDVHFEEGVGRYIDVTDWSTPPATG